MKTEKEVLQLLEDLYDSQEERIKSNIKSIDLQKLEKIIHQYTRGLVAKTSVTDAIIEMVLFAR